MKKLLLLCMALLCSCHLLHADDDMGELLEQLDKAIGNRPDYLERKQHEIDLLQARLKEPMDDRKRFDLLGELLEKCRSYSSDLTMFACDEREKVALRLSDQALLDNARMNKADALAYAGMYKEALDLIHDIRVSQLPDYLHDYYYHIYRTLYGLMADYAVTSHEKERYAALTDLYRDSLLQDNREDQLLGALIGADRYNVHGEYDKAVDLLENYLRKQPDNRHDMAICAYTLSEAYRLKGDREQEKKWLIISATADMETAVREYVSLRKLAVLCYQEGDIDRAYAYLKTCMDDAVACNARLRKQEIVDIFPIVNDAYQQKVEKQQTQMMWALVSISLLTLFLAIAIYFVGKQMNRVAATRREVEEANKCLQQQKEELYNSNEQLKEANRSIAENSRLKEEYIGRYMDQCSVYLDKLDNYRRSLGKIAASGNVEALYKQIKSTKFIDTELKEFYTNFDETFLHLFPTFVEDFNALLAEGEQIHPKPGERMNAELRIFALIRLGITDSTQIAQFLRYSVTTIYNYRTKVRNKAAGERDKLEQEVMNIGKFQV